MPTKTKKKTTAKVKRAPINSKKIAEDEKIKLSNQVDKHKKTIQNLKAQVAEQNSVIKSRDAIKAEVDSLSATKEQLKIFISQNSSKEKAFGKIITDLTTQKSELDNYIDDVGPKKKKIQSELHELEKQKQENLAELENVNSESAKIQSEISDLEQSKLSTEQEIKELETQYGLYPRDLKSMSGDLKGQLKTYAVLAGASAGATFIWAILLVFAVTNPFIDQMTGLFVDQPNLQFYSMLTIILASIGGFSFLIYLFLNLTKGFVSQYINIRNRLTTLRVTDYLMSKSATGGSKDKADSVHDYILEIMRIDNSFDECRKRRKSKS